MACPRTTALVATLMFLTIPQDCQSYKNWRQGYRHRWPGVFMGSGSDGGAFRPLQSYCSRRGAEFRNGLPLLDIFEEVVGDISKAARELAESHSDTSIRTPRHQVLDGTESVIINVELPGCKKQNVDAHISGDDGDKILRITAVRKRPRNTVSSSGSDDSGNRDEGPPGRTATESSPWTEEIFELSFRLGENIDVSGVRGKMEDGILMLIIPKVPPEPPAEPIDIPIDFPEEGDGGADKEVRRRSKGVEETDGGRQDSISNTRISLS